MIFSILAPAFTPPSENSGFESPPSSSRLSLFWPLVGISGVTIAPQYRVQGANLLGEKATFPDGSNGVEAGVMDLLDRMKTGRFKVAAHLNDWWEEIRLYHRKDGTIVKEGYDRWPRHALR